MADEEKSTKRKRRNSGEKRSKDSGQKRSRDSGEKRSRSASDGGRRSGGHLSGAKVAQLARRQLAEITGLEAESATSLERSDDGAWNVTVELLELSRVPETDDMLGLYQVQLDESGELIGYRRLRRYSRSQAGEGGGGAQES